MADKRLMALEGFANVHQTQAVDSKEFIGKKPTKIIPVPPDYRRETLHYERQHLINDIKLKTNCTVFVTCDKRGNAQQFELFGSGQGIEKATIHLNQWIIAARSKSKYTRAWAKLPAFDFNRWYYDRVEVLEDERKLKFKGQPPEPGICGPPLLKTLVDWPSDLAEDDKTPRDFFGNKLEVIDQLCMQDEVYIKLLSGRKGLQFELRGYDLEGLETAKGHLRTMIETVQDSRDGQGSLHIPLDYQEGLEVILMQHESWWPQLTDRVMPRLIRSPIMEEQGTFRHKSIEDSDLYQVQNALERALKLAGRRRGAYELAIRLGSLALSSRDVSDQKIGQQYPKDKFLREVNGPFQMNVKKWLSNYEVGLRILNGLMNTNDLLEPAKPADAFAQAPDELKDTRATLRGTFVFKDPSRATQTAPSSRHVGRPAPIQLETDPGENMAAEPESFIVIQIDWTEDEDGCYEKGAPRFYKLEPGKSGPRKNMDVSLLELGESRGWHFALESYFPLPKQSISPVLTSFAAGVQYDKRHDIDKSKYFAKLNLTGTMKKYFDTGRLDKTYTFGIKDTSYVVEYTAMWYPNRSKPTWSFSVRHPEWATHLAELERLPLGGQAGWNDVLSTFFPEDSHFSADTPASMHVSSRAARECGLGMEQLSFEDSGPPRLGLRLLIDKMMQFSQLINDVASQSLDEEEQPLPDDQGSPLDQPAAVRHTQKYAAFDYSMADGNSEESGESDCGVSIII